MSALSLLFGSTIVPLVYGSQKLVLSWEVESRRVRPTIVKFSLCGHGEVQEDNNTVMEIVAIVLYVLRMVFRFRYESWRVKRVVVVPDVSELWEAGRLSKHQRPPKRLMTKEYELLKYQDQFIHRDEMLERRMDNYRF